MQNIPHTYKTLELSEGKLEFVNKVLDPGFANSEHGLVIRPLIVGICRSDVKEFLGTRTIRHDFGHEILGEVLIGSEPSLPAAGDLVVLDPHILINRESAFGELLIASGSVDAMTRAFVKVPATVPKEKLVFVEPLSCAQHCVSNLKLFLQSDYLSGYSVCIVGAGMTGILIGLLCKYYGADVTIVNRGEERLNFLRTTSIFAKEKVVSTGQIKGAFDVVIPTTTFLQPEVLELCAKLIKDNGTILLYGGTKKGDLFPGSEVDVDEIRREQKKKVLTIGTKSFRVCGTHGARTDDFRTIIDLLSEAQDKLPVERLIRARIKLADVPEVIAAMAREDSLGKTVVEI